MQHCIHFEALNLVLHHLIYKSTNIKLTIYLYMSYSAAQVF